MLEIGCGGPQALVDFALNGSFHALRDDIERYQKEFQSTEEGEIAGALFESLAYGVLKSRMPEGIELLSPETTLDYYRYYLHPEAPVIENFFTSSLEGVSVPDGLAIESDEEASHIRVVFEYTTNRDPSYFQDKYHAFSMGEKRYPTVFAHTQLIFVTLSSGNIFADHQKAQTIESINRQRINVWMLSVTRDQFGQFARNIASTS